MRSRRCSRRSTGRRPTRSGASATSSATGRARTAAAPLVAERADLCLVGNHDLGVLGRLDLDDFSPDAPRAPAGRRTCSRPRPARSSSRSSPRASATASASSTRARATRSGSTSSRPASRYAGARRDAAGRSSSSATATSRSRFRLDERRRSRPRAGGHGARARRRPLAPEPRLGRPAARRRPARRLAPARPRGAAGDVPARRLRRRADAGGDPRARPPGGARRAPRARHCTGS